MAYSEDYRKRAVEFYREGSTQEEVRKVFKIARSTLRDWEARYEAGSLKPSYPKVRIKPKLPYDQLKQYIDDNPDAFLSEIGEHFGCSAEAVRKALIKLNITLKKRRSATRNAVKSNVPNMKEK